MEPVLNAAQVMEILPHRYPFLLIDKITQMRKGPDPSSRVGGIAVAIKNVTINEHFFIGHFPGRPVMPGVLLIEAMAQTGALAFYREEDAAMNVAIATVKEARFRRPVVPGDTLQLTAEIKRDRGQMLLISCTAHVDGTLVAEAEILAAVQFKNNGH